MFANSGKAVFILPTGCFLALMVLACALIEMDVPLSSVNNLGPGQHQPCFDNRKSRQLRSQVQEQLEARFSALQRRCPECMVYRLKELQLRCILLLQFCSLHRTDGVGSLTSLIISRV